MRTLVLSAVVLSHLALAEAARAQSTADFLQDLQAEPLDSRQVQERFVYQETSEASALPGQPGLRSGVELVRERDAVVRQAEERVQRAVQEASRAAQQAARAVEEVEQANELAEVLYEELAAAAEDSPERSYDEFSTLARRILPLPEPMDLYVQRFEDASEATALAEETQARANEAIEQREAAAALRRSEVELLAEVSASADGPIDAAVIPVVAPTILNIQLKPDLLGEDIHSFLDEYGLRLVDAIPNLRSIQVVDVETPQPDDPNDVDQLFHNPKLQQIREDPRVDAAFMEIAVSPNGSELFSVIAPPKVKAQSDEGKSVVWGVESLPAQVEPNGGWGLKDTRLPAVWRLVTSSDWCQAEAVRVGVIDDGFIEHQNLAYSWVDPANARAGAHGSHVLGIIAGRPTNDLAFAGVNPTAEVTVAPLDQAIVQAASAPLLSAEITNAWFALFTGVIKPLNEVVLRGTPAVVNLSVGYSWGKLSQLGGRTYTEEQLTSSGFEQEISNTAKYIRALTTVFGEDTLFVSAAGNDSLRSSSRTLHARWGSPFNYLALGDFEQEDRQNIIVVEAHDQDGVPYDRSNRGGDVSAPGVDIVSTGGGTAGFLVLSGTSMAAPVVTGVSALLLSCKPDLTPAEIKQLLISSARPSDHGDAPRVDALQAFLMLDKENAKRLTDLNRDGLVDDKDQILFSDTERKLAAGGTFTDDLNRDGLVNEFEMLFPIIDLNGSGAYDAEELPFGPHKNHDKGIFESAFSPD